ncbi:hypothetical protein ES319_D09G181600v1 [Gossypium barbadense]|uniref:Uncharacterized protein n=2 Tax=Gossypium TaxID=3633 RepID=A0A5J5QA72_GOSBA|nr:hypothetical protein ES319_D09G181600v1 [Gossypium barbadense]
MHQTFQKLSSIHGPLMYLRLGSVDCVVAPNPELAKELLKHHELTFSTRHHTAAIEHLTYNSSFAFAPYGPYWKFIKKLTTFELLGNRTLGQTLPVRTKELHHFIGILLGKSKSGETVNLTQELLKLTNNVISQMMLSIRCSGTVDQADGFRTLVREENEIFGYDSLLEKIMRDREELRKNKKPNDDDVKDFLDIMLDIFEDEHSEVQLTRNHIKALILDFLTAATDKTALIAVEWALAELINNPEVLRKAQQELDQVVGKSRQGSEGVIDVKGLHYQLLPFGTGRRGCPGISLAMQELAVTLAALVQCFDWNAGGGVDMSERPGLTAPRAYKLNCVPLARFTPTLFAT